MSDEGFHEIQLNGKQLVFLFMSATVVAVVIFLCGVMVGRGVPTGAASAIGAPSQATLDPTAAVQGASAVRAVAINGNGPATAQETLTYTTLLDDPDPPAETLAPPVESTADVPVRVVASRPAPELPKRVAAAPLPLPVAPKPVAVAPPVPVAPKLAAVASKSVAVAPRPVPVAPPPVAAPRPLALAPAPVTAGVALAEPAGAGFVVQVAAVRQRAEADTIARRLSTKGYPAFVTAAGANFRVRVGKYADRGEAESIAARLEKEERFKPWITR